MPRDIEEALAAGKDPNAASTAAPVLPITSVKSSQEQAAAALERKKASVVTSVTKASITNPVAMLAKSAPKEAPYPLEFALSHPSGVTAVDIDVIKLTAQYTAVNGREFLAGLAQREQRNPQFDFLKPTHMLFSFFTSLVDAYAKLVRPSEELLQRVQRRRQLSSALELSVHRWSWTRAEEERKREESQKEDSERLAFQQVDWNDFTIVETIDFREDELLDLPGLVPLTASDVNGVSSSAGQGSRMPPPPPPPPPAAALIPPPPPPPAAPLPPAPVAPANKTKPAIMEVDDDDDEIKVVTNYQPRIAGHGTQPAVAMTVDPITGKSIPLNQLEEHMRIQLIDPKWKEEQRRFQEKQSGYSGSLGVTEGDTIAESLRLFARKRGDIFGQSVAGTGADSARAIAEAQAKEQQQYQQQSAVQWDGHFTSAQSTMAQKAEVGNANGGVYAAYNTAVTVTPQGPAAMPPSTMPMAPAVHYPPPPPQAPMTMAPPPPPPSIP